MHSCFALTVDTDFCPPFMLASFLEIIQDFDVKVTLFCTGAYDLPQTPNIDVALHVNFLPGTTQGDGNLKEDERVRFLQQELPDATGIRTHRLYWHSGLYKIIRDAGLSWDSSLICPLQPHLAPQRGYGLTRFPIWWADGLHFDMGLTLGAFSPPGLNDTGLKVLLMHPVHMYMNTRSMKDLRQSLKNINFSSATPKQLESLRQPGFGMATVYMDALKLLKREGGGVLLKDLL